MPTVRSVQDATRDGKDGFIIDWEMIGFTRPMAVLRARGATALRFPTTIATVDIVGVSEFGERDYNVQVFVPTEGFLAAGIQNPVKWLREQFGERALM